jgi:hypothetical protein
MRTLVSIVIILICTGCFGQSGNWTWMNGSSTTVGVIPDALAQGVSSPTNTPGGRYGSVSMGDNNGNLWLFGGSMASGVILGDLWRYNIALGQWTWVSGSITTSNTGVYGTMGVPSTTNHPGARYLGGGCADHLGNLWIFGGYGYTNGTLNLMNDLWRYNIQTGQWTWMSGSSTTPVYGIYGTQGTGSALNRPGSRLYTNALADTSGNIWVFGGNGYGQGTTGSLNDLWKFTRSTSQWTWVKGSTVSNQFPTYGTKGVASLTVTPGARYAGTAASDNDGNLWYFGGYGLINGGTGYTNELWRFNVNNSTWTWLSGSPTADQAGIHGTINVAGASNCPGSRLYYGNSSMVDKTGNFWMFGGYGFSGSGAGYLSDLWRFNGSTNQWVWKKGSTGTNQYGQHGTMGTSAASNEPGARYYQTSMKDNNGRFWVYAGFGFSANTSGLLSDLWMYDVCAIPPVPVISPSLTLVKCSGATTTLSAGNGTVPMFWYNNATSTTAVANGTMYSPPALSAVGNTSVFTYYAEGFTCDRSATRAAVHITVHPTPTITVNSGSICEGGTFAMLPSGALTYTFSGGSQVVSPATNTSYVVSGTNSQGCTSTLNAIANVSVHPTPSITVNNGSICAGESFVVQPAGAATYTISSGSFTVAPASNTFYFVTGTSNKGCVTSTPAVVMVTVHDLPLLSVNSGSICSGGSFLLLPTGAVSYTYQGGSALVSPSVTTTYTINGANVLGCEANIPAIAHVIVHPSPTVSVVSSTITLCVGESATLSASGASMYSFSGISLSITGNGSAVINPPVTATYSITGYTPFGCTGMSTITQVVTVCTDISEHGQNNFVKVFPNPTGGLLNVELNETSKLSIYNGIGQLMWSETIEGISQLNFDSYPPGVYHLYFNSSKYITKFNVIRQ